MDIQLIVAAAENHAIGKDNKMLWHLPNDLKFFKNQTWGLPILMGSKTFQSLGYKTLPGRMNIVMTRQAHLPNEKAMAVASLKEAILLATDNDFKRLMVIGGGEMYSLALPFASKVFLTRVHTIVEDADTFFPELDPKLWTLKTEQPMLADEKNPFDYSFQEWVRK